MSEPKDVIVKVVKAFRPGDVVFIESDRPMSAEQYMRMSRELNEMVEVSGIRIILLDHGLRIASRIEERQRDKI